MPRKPKPVELKLVAGNAGKRRLPNAEDLPKADGRPPTPPGLKGEYLVEWNRLVADLEAAGTLGRENGAAIEIYVRNLVRMRKAEKHVEEFGPIVPTPRTGVPMHNPYLTTANKAAEIVARMGAELGLTPAARGRVTKLAAPKDDQADEFFKPPAGTAPKRSAATH